MYCVIDADSGLRDGAMLDIGSYDDKDMASSRFLDQVVFFTLGYFDGRAWIILRPSTSHTPPSVEAPALKTSSDCITHDIRMLVDKTAKRINPLHGDRLVMPFIQSPGNLVQVSTKGKQLIVGLT